MYYKSRYVAGQTIDIHKTYSKRRGKSVSRGELEAPTPKALAEAIDSYNKKLSSRDIIRRMNKYFKRGDSHLILKYWKDVFPTKEEWDKHTKKFFRDIGGVCKKAGYEMFRIKATGISVKGRVHHHIVINVCDVRLIQKFWPHGSVNIIPLYSEGDFSALANYLARQCKEHKDDKGFVITAKGWTCSRNVKKVEPKVEKPKAKQWREPPEAEKGYIIDVDSIDAGINPVTGVPFLFYRQRRITPLEFKNQNALDLILMENREKAKALWNAAMTKKPIPKIKVLKPEKKGGGHSANRAKPRKH